MDSSAQGICLIVGCGYVGHPLAQGLSRKGWRVGAVVKSDSSREKLSGQGFEVLQGDVADCSFWDDLHSEWGHVVYCPSTGGGGVSAYREIHELGLKHCLEWLPDGSRLFYTSSTSVYGQEDGELVDESSITTPRSESAQELVHAEQRVCTAGQTVLRLGGIYGPERGVLLKRLREGKALIPEQDPKWLNLVYLSDIVSAITYGLSGRLVSGEVYNVIDNQPSSYREIYQWLCERLEMMVPPIGTPDYFGKRGMSNKRVSNQKLRNTGWQPEYSSFRDGYTEMLKAEK